jgi:hypothetical protein
MSEYKETQIGTFGWALEQLKQDKLVMRKGWNGKNQFVFRRPENTLNVDFIINKVKSLPESVKTYYNSLASSQQLLWGQTEVKFTSYLCMKAADGTIVNGWLASQTDMLSEDWEEFVF